MAKYKIFDLALVMKANNCDRERKEIIMEILTQLAFSKQLEPERIRRRVKDNQFQNRLTVVLNEGLWLAYYLLSSFDFVINYFNLV